MSGISIIAAVAHGGAIGRNGELLFHISADLRRFRQITMGHPIIMGRKTFQSFPNGPLPGRRNIVVSRNPDFTHEGVDVFGSLDDALSATDDAMVIGGGDIYRQAMPSASALFLTEIDADVTDADTFFPEIDPSGWVKTYESEWMTDPRSDVRFRFVDLVRKQ